MRRALVALAASTLVLGAAPPARVAPAPDAAGHDVTVTVGGLRSTKGVVRACMTENAKRFPRCAGDDAAHSLVVPAATELVLTFRGVAPGRYAIALLHDENNNGKADRALGMMPTEGFGFSRDAPVRMAPPAFIDAVVPVDGRNLNLSIKMRYLL